MSGVPEKGEIESDWYDTEPSTSTESHMMIAAGIGGTGGWLDINSNEHANAICEVQ